MSVQASLISPHEVRVASFKKAMSFIKYFPHVTAVIIFLWVASLLVEKVQDPSFLPISKIRIKGEMKYVTEAMLQKSITGLLNGGFFNTDVEKIQQAVESLPWVERASVRRVWPETLFIQVIEQQPVAKWVAGGFINLHGEVFRPEDEKKATRLPVWSAPQGTELILYKKNDDLKKMLSVTGLTISKLTMDKRHAIKLEVDNGVTLILGRKEQLSRLQNFIDIYKKILAGKMNKINKVDLRYSNGMSIGWKAAPTGAQ